METIVQSFTSNLRRVLAQAAQLATAEQKKIIEPSHLFYGLVNQAETTITDIASLKKSQRKISPARKISGAQSIPPTLSAMSKKILMDSAALAQSYNHTYVGTEHLLVVLLESKNPKIKELLSSLQIDANQLDGYLRTLMKSSAKLLDILDTILTTEHGGAAGGHHHDHEHEEQCCNDHDHGDEQDQKGKPARRERRVSALEFFSTLLTHPDVARTLDPCIGRTAEIERLIRILARRTKNNPVLVGDPGVGKTAIVEGLAKKIAEGDIPEFLRDKKIYSLNLTSLIAGSAFRGELEIRLKHVIDEVKADPNAILFIDEIHNIVGAGSAQGALDTGNIIKPALARGELRCIGATTGMEYKRHIEDDPALERRFQQISVKPPSIQDAKDILKGLAAAYEHHHKIKISPEAIDSAVELSERYITEKNLPDKAIDVIDEASAKLRLNARSWQEQTITNAQERIGSIVGAQTDHAQLKELLTSLKDTLDNANGPTLPTLRKEHVAEIIANICGVPTHALLQDEKEKLLHLEAQLSERIVGQDHAKAAVALFIRRARAGLMKKGRPLASFLFLGPSGVGKTELARVLADVSFGSNGYIKLDMSEFSESFTISRLIGAPNGYVGYKEGGRLTESVRQKPSSLVLFDEIEKAHPRVLQILLQIMDDGCLTDSSGKRVDFSNTIIVMTSNIGARFYSSAATIGFEGREGAKDAATRDAVASEVKRVLNPELLSRIDKTILFEKLDAKCLREIAELHLCDLRSRMQQTYGMLNWTSRALNRISTIAASKDNGAREIRHIIEHEVEGKIAELLLASSKPAHECAVSVDAKDGTFICSLE
ncbi:ATP-dependent Clp protease ATP-binding subunit [Candidatus Uhrbacteria bacterium]|nr:ATP-dependent Clp protease ATP-binding subunit [Candidatus Uhrbacteria bacterium]